MNEYTVPANLAPTYAIIEGASPWWSLAAWLAFAGMIILPLYTFRVLYRWNVGSRLEQAVSNAIHGGMTLRERFGLPLIGSAIAFGVMLVVTAITWNIETDNKTVYYAAEGTCIVVVEDTRTCVGETDDMGPIGIQTDDGTTYDFPLPQDMTQVEPR